MDSKVCRDCGEEKLVSEFWRQNKRPDGLGSYCKSCDNRRRRANKRRQLEDDWVCQRVRVKIENGLKRCSRCHERKPLAEFAIANGRGGYHGYCKPCHAAWAREYRRRPDKIEHLRALKRASKFRLTLVEYNRLVESHAGKCAICDGPGGVHGLGIDHDHNGLGLVVRGLLCSNCNAGIAMFRDDPDWMLKAVDYLRKWHAVSAASQSS